VRRSDRIASFIAMIAGDGTEPEDNLSTGLYMSVVCNEIFNPADQSAFDAANAAIPTKIRDQFGGGWYAMKTTCANYPKNNLQAQLKQPVTSAVRTWLSTMFRRAAAKSAIGDPRRRKALRRVIGAATGKAIAAQGPF
jgi:hypothetical protein